MRFSLTIQCDNAAFEDEPRAEVARILREAAEHVETTEAGKLRDGHGNTIGGFHFEHESDD